MKIGLEEAWPIPDELHVRQAVKKLVEGFHPLQIFAFGSYASGSARHGSDLDLLVVLDEVGDRREVSVAMRRALADLPVPKDVLVTTQQEIEERGWIIGTVLREALTNGMVVYNRDNCQ
jgi:uncharacterized protein